MILISKIATVIGWILILVNWVSPLGSFYTVLHWTGLFLIVAHTIESIVFLPKAKQAGLNPGLQWIQLFIFGYPHAMALDNIIKKQQS